MEFGTKEFDAETQKNVDINRMIQRYSEVSPFYSFEEKNP